MNEPKKHYISKGNCEHEVWGYKEDTTEEYNHCIQTNLKGVYIANNDDGHYYQRFETPEELDAFIAKLVKTKEEVFGDE